MFYFCSIFILGGRFRLARFAHPAAADSADPACIGAFGHVQITAGLRAGIAYFRAGPANGLMMVRPAGHKIRGLLAYLNTIGHQTHMVRRDVSTALLHAHAI